jgi:hypothetical protein
MLPSKDDELRVTYSPDGSPVEERGEAFNGVQENESLSRKKQMRMDLTPSLHRNT